MRPLKAQYFLSYGVIGNIQPFMPLLLKERGLSLAQVGYVLAASSVAVLVTPVIVGLLADTRADPRRLMAGVYLFSGLTALALWKLEGFWPILCIYALHCLTFVPAMSLQDGMYFRLQRDVTRRGGTLEPYHRVRVWGTFGFIVPGLFLFVLIRQGVPTSVLMLTAAGYCVAGAVNAFLLPEGCAARGDDAHEERRLPTVAAARAMLRPDVLALCVGMFIAQVGITAYYAFYPIYLRDRAGLGNEWAGLIADVGVGVEVLFMLGFGRLERRFGVRQLLVAGALCTAVRVLMLAASGSVAVAVGSQLMHGMMVLVLHVLPAIYLNRAAGDRYRTSMQALYGMAVTGTARITGNALSGRVAGDSLERVFLCSGILAIIAAIVFAVFFRERKKPA